MHQIGRGRALFAVTRNAMPSLDRLSSKLQIVATEKVEERRVADRNWTVLHSQRVVRDVLVQNQIAVHDRFVLGTNTAYVFLDLDFFPGALDGSLFSVLQ